jgi:chloramphenicol-sensitive protein RarD
VNANDDARLGLTVALITQVIWGFLPVWAAIYPQTPAMQMLMFRVLFCGVSASIFVFAFKQGGALMELVRTPKKWPPYLAAAIFLGTNWLVFFLAVQAGRVLEVSFGTYLLPLLSIAMGVLFLSEKLTLWTGAGLASAALGVAVMSLGASGPPWLGLILAGSFSAYTLLRKLYPIAPLVGLTFETWAMAPLALAYLFLTPNNHIFAQDNIGHIVWLISFGPQTALTMAMFNYATGRLRMATTGMLQFVSPTLVFIGALLNSEPLSLTKAGGFALIWLGVAFYLIEALRARAALRSQMAADIANFDVR